MPSSAIGVLGPENGTDSIREGKSDEPHELQTLETINSILAPAGAAAHGGQQGLELLGSAPGLAYHLDTEVASPRSKIRIFAVMGALLSVVIHLLLQFRVMFSKYHVRRTRILELFLSLIPYD